MLGRATPTVNTFHWSSVEPLLIIKRLCKPILPLSTRTCQFTVLQLADFERHQENCDSPLKNTMFRLRQIFETPAMGYFRTERISPQLLRKSVYISRIALRQRYLFTIYVRYELSAALDCTSWRAGRQAAFPPSPSAPVTVLSLFLSRRVTGIEGRRRLGGG